MHPFCAVLHIDIHVVYQSWYRLILFATQLPDRETITINTTQRYPPKRCLEAERANSELYINALDIPMEVRRVRRTDLTMVGPTVIASDCTSSARPFAVPSDAVPGVQSRVRIITILPYHPVSGETKQSREEPRTRTPSTRGARVAARLRPQPTSLRHLPYPRPQLRAQAQQAVARRRQRAKRACTPRRRGACPSCAGARACRA